MGGWTDALDSDLSGPFIRQLPELAIEGLSQFERDVERARVACQFGSCALHTRCIGVCSRLPVLLLRSVLGKASWLRTAVCQRTGLVVVR